MRKNGKFMVNQPNMKKAVGYCHSGQHQGFMSEKMIKSHKCLAKNCPYLEKYENAEFWIRRAQIKELKKLRKEAERVAA